MQKFQCPTCGRETAIDAAQPGCEHLSATRAVRLGDLHPDAPEEVANWIIDRPSPEMLAWAKETFDEEEYLAGLREINEGKGFRLEDFIEEIERICPGKE